LKLLVEVQPTGSLSDSLFPLTSSQIFKLSNLHSLLTAQWTAQTSLMCRGDDNRKKTTCIPLSMKMEGSATEALERYLKKQRTVSTYKYSIVALEAAFELDQASSSLCVPEESFPSISWDSEEEPGHHSVTENPPSVGLLRKRDREGVALGFARSKSLKQGLNSLISATNSTATVPSLCLRRWRTTSLLRCSNCLQEEKTSTRQALRKSA
jgi:hypothetical protein